MSTLFSAPKVQISRVVDKYLSDAPSADAQQLGVFREQSEVVAALVCFADHLLETGTAAEYAEKLAHRMQQESDERKIAWQQEVENKRRRYVSCLLCTHTCCSISVSLHLRSASYHICLSPWTIHHTCSCTCCLSVNGVSD
jgi:hypothetical protein